MDVLTARRVADPPGGRRRRTWARLLLAGGGMVAVAAILLVAALLAASRPVPAFPSLADAPDPSLRGTVAYFADATSCVKVVAASGRPSKEVLCLPSQDPSQAEKLGKLVGPQLVWRRDGRLEVTMFRLTNPPGPSFGPGWQKVVDVRTRTVREVPASDIPSRPDLSTQPTTAADGRRISWTSNDDGQVEVVLHERDQSRVLLSVHGPGEGTYHMSAFWGPDGQWIAADDGRILVVTTGDPAVTRVLTAESTRGGYGGYPRFAVTGLDLLASAS